jgi:hypothetical protein
VGLESFSLETFTPHVGSTFRIVSETDELELRLASATPIDLDSSVDAGELERVPFNLQFHGPPEPVWHQGTYDLAHERLGTFPLFIVPLGPDQGVMRYEAIFY